MDMYASVEGERSQLQQLAPPRCSFLLAMDIEPRPMRRRHDLDHRSVWLARDAEPCMFLVSDEARRHLK